MSKVIIDPFYNYRFSWQIKGRKWKYRIWKGLESWKMKTIDSRGKYDLKLTFADIPQYFITINLEVNLQSLLLGYD